MKKLIVVVGLDYGWTHQEKKQICRQNGIDVETDLEYAEVDFLDLDQQKKQVNQIVKRVKYGKQLSATMFINSDVALQWFNNAVMLSKVKKPALEERIGMTSIEEEQVQVYEYNKHTGKMNQLVMGARGYEFETVNRYLRDLFESTLLVQDELEEIEN